MIEEHFNEAEIIRPFLNTVPMFDIISGSPIQLPDGTTIVNGGLSPITGVAGMPNAFKSAVAHFFNLSTINNYYPYVTSLAYDTEESMSYNRMRMLAARMYPLNTKDLRNDRLLFITDSAQHLGGDWWDRLKKLGRDIIKNYKKMEVTLPWIDPATKTYAKTLRHTNVEMDSISMFQAEVSERMYEDNIIGDSGLNTEAMRGQSAKTQMLMQMPTYTQRARMNIIMTAHMGKVIPMDPRLPPDKKLAFMKQNYSFKHVGEKFYFLTNNLWICLNVKPLLNQATKLPEFPRNPDDDIKRDVDLVSVTIQNARAKSGPTGGQFDIVASQREGLLMDISNLNYIKERKHRTTKKPWGIGGNVQRYFCDLWPDVVVQRTTVRKTLDTDPLFRRAVELCLELCLMKDFWNRDDYPEMIAPEDLYLKIKEMGLDWEVLLNTQSQYTYKEVREARPDIPPTMTAIDLLNVAHGKLKLPWYETHAKKIQALKSKEVKTEKKTESKKDKIEMPSIV